MEILISITFFEDAYKNKLSKDKTHTGRFKVEDLKEKLNERELVRRVHSV